MPGRGEHLASILSGKLPRWQHSSDGDLRLKWESDDGHALQDAEIAAQIDRDLERTHPSSKFFAGDSKSSLRNRVLHPLSCYRILHPPVASPAPHQGDLLTPPMMLWWARNLTGVDEEHSSSVRQAQSCSRLCARDERGPGPSVLRIQLGSRRPTSRKSTTPLLRRGSSRSNPPPPRVLQIVAGE